jgi:hypothetical protein
MSLKHSTGLKNYALASGLRPAFDTNGRLDIYTGAQPANADAAATGTKLATINLAATAFKAAANGGIALNGPLSATVLASGTAGWFRFYLATETAPGSAAGATDKRLDGTIGSGQDMNVDNAALVAGGTVQIADGGWVYNHSA